MNKERPPPLLPFQPHLLCPRAAWSSLFCFMSRASSWVSSSLIYLHPVHFPLHSQNDLSRTQIRLCHLSTWNGIQSPLSPGTVLKSLTWSPRLSCFLTQLSLAPSPLSLYILASPSSEPATRHHDLSGCFSVPSPMVVFSAWWFSTPTLSLVQIFLSYMNWF